MSSEVFLFFLSFFFSRSSNNVIMEVSDMHRLRKGGDRSA